MEVARSAEDDGLAVGYTLLLVRPLTRKLQRRLNCFRTRVHGQDHVVPEHVRDLLRKFTKHRVIECA